MQKKIVFVSSNGAGMGHLTRLVAIARRLPDGYQPAFFTMSFGFPILQSLGNYPAEYVMSASYSGLGPNWDDYLSARLQLFLHAVSPAAVVLDGSVPYKGLLSVARQSDIPFVWSRRGLWRTDALTDHLLKSGEFTAVIEPGDHCERADHGATASLRQWVSRVDPISLLDEEEMMDPPSARSKLGISQNGRAVLVSLGAGNINDASAPLNFVLETLASYPDTHVIVATPIIANERIAQRASVKNVSIFPIARYLKAFDLCVSAAGYNTVQENIRGGLPTIYVPTPSRADDQSARAEETERMGVGICARDITGLRAALEVLDDVGRLESMRESCKRFARPNGALAAARLVTAVADGSYRPGRPTSADLRRALPARTIARRTRQATTGAVLAMRQHAALRRLFRKPPLDAATTITGGVALTNQNQRPQIEIVSLAEETELIDAIETFRRRQRSGELVKPVFLTGLTELSLLKEQRYAIEHLPTVDHWQLLDVTVPRSVYIHSRISFLRDFYAPLGSPDH